MNHSYLFCDPQEIFVQENSEMNVAELDLIENEVAENIMKTSVINFNQINDV